MGAVSPHFAEQSQSIVNPLFTSPVQSDGVIGGYPMITVIVAAAAFAAGVYFSESAKALISKVM